MKYSFWYQSYCWCENRFSWYFQSIWQLDIFKAFDKCWHDGLNFKLKSYGVEVGLLSLPKSCLQNREQKVVLNGPTSGCRKINSGVHQGLVLWPFLFLIYIEWSTWWNNFIVVKFLLKALFSKVLDINKAVTELDTDLEKIKSMGLSIENEV